jgi:hypothetical protein
MGSKENARGPLKPLAAAASLPFILAGCASNPSYPKQERTQVISSSPIHAIDQCLGVTVLGIPVFVCPDKSFIALLPAKKRGAVTAYEYKDIKSFIRGESEASIDVDPAYGEATFITYAGQCAMTISVNRYTIDSVGKKCLNE